MRCEDASHRKTANFSLNSEARKRTHLAKVCSCRFVNLFKLLPLKLDSVKLELNWIQWNKPHNAKTPRKPFSLQGVTSGAQNRTRTCT